MAVVERAREGKRLRAAVETAHVARRGRWGTTFDLPPLAPSELEQRLGPLLRDALAE